MAGKKPKISVYITNHNYGKYLQQSIESVLNQTEDDFELIIIDDASTDNSGEILSYYEDHPKITVIRNEENHGLVRSARRAIEHSRGDYIKRLDSDDWLDENALLVLSKVLDNHPEIGLVYPDYFEVDKHGNITNHIRRKKIGHEVELFDLPAHGACTMIRRSFYDEVGGYSEDIDRQDGYDLWLKFMPKYKPMNVNLPLFYYRKHRNNLTDASLSILDTRKKIKQKAYEKMSEGKNLKILGIIPTRSYSSFMPNMPLEKLAGKELISYSIDALKEADVNKSVVVSDNKEFLGKISNKYDVETLQKPAELAKTTATIDPTIYFTLKEYQKNGFNPDVVVVLYVTSPLITGKHIKEATQTLALYQSDSVISVKENRIPHYRHEKTGLTPITPDRILKHERDILFEATGSLVVTRADVITPDNFIGKKLSHILLAEEEAVDINNKFEWWFAEQVIENKEELGKWLGQK